MKKYVALLLGSVIGYTGFLYSKKKKDGLYSLGLPDIVEYLGIIIYMYFSIISRETVSTILLQSVCSWHISAVADKFSIF